MGASVARGCSIERTHMCGFVLEARSAPRFYRDSYSVSARAIYLLTLYMSVCVP